MCVRVCVCARMCVCVCVCVCVCARARARVRATKAAQVEGQKDLRKHESLVLHVGYVSGSEPITCSLVKDCNKNNK